MARVTKAIDFSKWKECGGVDTVPLIHKGVLYLGACDKHLYALSTEDGEPIWMF